MSIADLLAQLVSAANANSPPQAAQHFDQVARQAPPDMLGDGVAEAFRSNQTPPFPDMVSQMFGQADPNQRASLLNQILAAAGPAILSGAAGGVLGRVLGAGAPGMGGMGGMGGLGGLGGLGGMPPGAGGGLGGAMSGGLGGVLGSVLGSVLGGGASGAPGAGMPGGQMPGGPTMGDPSAGPMHGGMAGGPIPQVTPEQASQITPEQMREIAAQAEREQPGIIDQLGSFAARNPDLVKMLGGVAMAVIASRMASRMQR